MQHRMLAAAGTWIVGSLTAGALALDGDLCGWKSQTSPDPLTGKEGSSTASKYLFTHSSDVDTAGDHFRYTHLIHNDHPTLLLPATWLRGKEKKVVVVRFERIPPGSCGSNVLESGFEGREDPSGFIRYGQQLQEQKEARLYVPKDDAQAEREPAREGAARPAPGLTSRMSVTVDPKDEVNAQAAFDVALISEWNGTTARISLRNDGDRLQRVSIPALAALDLLEKRGVRVEGDWQRQETSEGRRIAIVEPKQQATMSLEFPRGLIAVAQAVEIQIRDADGVIAAGWVTVHLPPKQ